MSILSDALYYNLDLCISELRVEVRVYDEKLSETFMFSEHVNQRKERLAALARCVELATQKAKTLSRQP